MNFLKTYANVFIIFFLSIIAFHLNFGLYKLNPSNINWLFLTRADWATNYLGWQFFRESPWQFPIGGFSNYNYPIGTNIGFTDSIPLMAILLKPFSFLLPERFQYHGIWLLLSLYLNGYYSFKIFTHFRINRILSFLFVAFILICPVFIFRQLHTALCAHWLLIGPIYLYLSSSYANEKATISKIRHHLILLVISCFVTPYITAAVFGFFIVFLFKLSFFDKALGWLKAVLYAIGSVVLIFISWFILGILSFSNNIDNASSGFYGIYKLNLNGLYNPLSYSNFLPEHKLISGYQQDAFMYLGLGILVIFVVAILYFIYVLVVNKKTLLPKKTIPLFLLAVGLTLFAVTHLVSLNDKVILTIPLLDKISHLGDIFRASGRMFWSVYYLIILFSFVVFAKIPMKDNIKITVVAILLLVQGIDISNLFNKTKFDFADYQPPVNSKNWDKLYSQFKNIITVMPFESGIVNPADYQDLSFFAMKNHNNVTAGITARNDGTAIKAFTNALILTLTDGNLPEENLYITSKENLKYFSRAYQKGLINIINLDNYYFVYSKKKILKSGPIPSPQDIAGLERAKSENLKTVQFQELNRLEKSSGKVKYNTENEFIQDGILQLSGWALIENTMNNAGDSIFIYLKNDKKIYRNKCLQRVRKDISIVFKSENLDNSGFEIFAFTDNIEKGQYEFSVGIKNVKGEMYYSDSKTIGIGLSDEIFPAPAKNTAKVVNDLRFGIDGFEYDKKVFQVRGWAALDNTDSKDSRVEITLQDSDDNFYQSATNQELRTDVTAALKSKFNLDNSGFNAKINTTKLPKATYKIGIRIINDVAGRDIFFLTDKLLEVK